MFLVIGSLKRGSRGAGPLGDKPSCYQFPLSRSPACRPGMTHLSLHRARPGLSLAQKTACVFCCCYLAIMPGSFLSMNSCIHWCSVELLRNLRKDSTYLLWSVNRLLMEDAIFGFLKDREGRDVLLPSFPFLVPSFSPHPPHWVLSKKKKKTQTNQTPQQACFELKVLPRLGVQKLILNQYLHRTLPLRLHPATVIFSFFNFLKDKFIYFRPQLS